MAHKDWVQSRWPPTITGYKDQTFVATRNVLVETGMWSFPKQVFGD